jgi:hypothetical protein
MALNRADYDALLVADMDELRGTGDSVIAARVRNDEQMRAAADRILVRTAAVDEALTRSRPTRTRVHAMRPRMGRVGRATLLSGGLAAAAIAGILGRREMTQRMPAQAEQPITATLNASSTRPFAVIPTDNPDIAIVWLFNKEGK